METNKQKNEILELLSKNETEKALREIISVFNKFQKSAKFQNEYNQVVLLRSRHEEVKKKNYLGIINNEDYQIEKNKIVFSILEFINILSAEVWALKPENPTLNYNRVIQKKTDDFKYDVFICHSSLDKNISDKVWQTLEENNINTFYSSESLKKEGGTSFFEKIEYALINSKHFLLISTSNSIKSEWVKVEYQTFFNECYLKNKTQRKFVVFSDEKGKAYTIPLLLRRLQNICEIDQLASIFKNVDIYKSRNKIKPITRKRNIFNPLKKIFPILISLVIIISCYYFLRNAEFSHSATKNTESGILKTINNFIKPQSKNIENKKKEFKTLSTENKDEKNSSKKTELEANKEADRIMREKSEAERIELERSAEKANIDNFFTEENKANIDNDDSKKSNKTNTEIGTLSKDITPTNYTLNNEGYSYSLSGRNLLIRPVIVDDSMKKGTVVIRVKVDRNGNVISASHQIKGSTTSDDYLVQKAIGAAKHAKFNSDPNAANEQVGTITYVFKVL